MSTDLCTIAFQAEAHDSAVNVLRGIIGWSVDVFPTRGEPFTATLEDLVIDPDSGQWAAHLREFDHDRPAPNGGGALHMLDIYDDIDRLEPRTGPRQSQR